jgi:cytochrome b561
MMNTRNTIDRYGSFSVALHWVMLLLIVAVYSCIELRVIFPKGSDLRLAMSTWHFMLGLSVMVLALLRLILNITSATPRIVPDPPKWQKLSSKFMHIALYALMIGLPIIGWLLLSAKGKQIPFFGLNMPSLIAENKDLATTIKEIHETVGTLGYYLIGAHAAAALFHHYVLRDNTIKRILPVRD